MLPIKLFACLIKKNETKHIRPKYLSCTRILMILIIHLLEKCCRINSVTHFGKIDWHIKLKNV